MFSCLTRKTPSYGGYKKRPSPAMFYDPLPYFNDPFSLYLRDKALETPNAYITANLNRSRELYEDLGFRGDQWPFSAVPSNGRARSSYTPHFDDQVIPLPLNDYNCPCFNRNTVYPPSASYTPRFRGPQLDVCQHQCNSYVHGSWGIPSEFVTGDLRDPNGHKHYGYKWPTYEAVEIPAPKHKGPNHFSRPCPCGCLGAIGSHYVPCCSS